MTNEITMKMNINKGLLLVFIGYCSFISLFAQQSTDSLMSYLELAAKRNPVVLQRFYEYQAALQKVPQVGSLPDPELSTGIFLNPMEIINGNQVADIRLMQMFPWFGVLKNAKNEMSLMAKAKYESFRDVSLQMSLDVQRTWYELQKNQQIIRISENNIEILHTLERLALVKFKSAPASGNGNSASGTSQSNSSNQGNSNIPSGMYSMGNSASANSTSSVSNSSSSMQSSTMSSQSSGSRLADLYRIQIEIGDMENNIALLKNQQNTLLARFNTYLNRPVESQVTLPDSLKADTLTLSLLAISDSMLANNPMLSMLEYEQQSLDARKQMVSGMSYPMIGLGVNYSVITKSEMSTSAMNGKDMIMPMLTVTLPIYQKKYKALKAEADLLKSATQQGLQASSNSLQIEYYEAIQLFEDSGRKMKLYEDQSRMVKSSFDLMVKSFSVSGTDLTEVLRVRQQLLDYETKQVEAIANYNSAIAWLMRLGAFTQVQ
jgi:outer membrane protein TolC